jgi:flagellar protein FlaG
MMDVNNSQVGKLFAQEFTNGPLASQQLTQVDQVAKQETQILEAKAQEFEAQQVQPAETEQAISEVGDFLQSLNRQLSFSVDDTSNRTVVSVVDQSSGDVIRQIPSEEILRIAEKIKDLQNDVGSAVGILVNKAI